MTLKDSPQKCLWKAAGLAANSQRPPPLKPCLQHICCIHYLNHWPIPRVLKVFSVVLALYAHTVTIDAQR